jgi:hypothetical protein
MDYYILNDDHSVTSIPQEEYFELMQTDPEKYSITQHIRHTNYKGIRVSTIFMALDHSFNEGPPVLFESMVFYKDKKQTKEYYDQYQTRYTSYNDAIEGHRDICTKLNIPEEYINGIKGDKLIKKLDDLY